MKRIALLMAGDCRTFDLAFPNWVKNLYPYAKVDLFLSTWNKTSLYKDRMTDLPIENRFYDVNEKHIMNILDRYNITPKYLNIEEQINFAHRGNNQIYHWQRTLTKLINCADDYDFAILTRPDVIISNKLLGQMLNELDGEKIYSTDPLSIAPKHLSYCVTLYDIFFMSSPKNMIQCFLPVPYMSLNGEKINNNGMYNMHPHLADYFVRNRLHLEGIEYSGIAVYDHNCMLNPKVVIPIAGKGTRLLNLTENFNKALLPYKNKTVLSHIIESFPDRTDFVIPIGYEKEKVKNFILNVYPKKQITFVEVDDYESEKSGPGYTLKQCEEHLNNAFWYVPCDTYFEESLPIGLNEDCYFVKSVDKNLHSEYTTFKIHNDRITDIQFKKSTDESYKAFTGVMYIHDFQTFFHNIDIKKSKEVIDGISLGSQVRDLNTWEDMGNYNNYNNLCNQNRKYDFTKTDEYTYFINGKVVKYFKDKDVATKKYIKALSNTNVIPSGLSHADHWLVYDFVPGKTLYELNDTTILPELLNWLDKRVWRRSEQDLLMSSNIFYRDKTLARLEKLREIYTTLPVVNSVDGIDVKDIDTYLFNEIDWVTVTTNNAASFIHGDLQFDNVIVDENRNFCIIDWRHDFGGNIEVGDVYYDLAKLYGGFILNYSKIKKGEFSVTNVGNDYTLDIPYIDNFNEYVSILEKFMEENYYNIFKIRTLVALIFLNMAPLHHKPFDIFLYCLSLKLLSSIRNDTFI